MSALSRRTLVRTGVTTAWTAPIVVLAVPAQAAACSGGVVHLAAQEVAGSRVVSFDDASGVLSVDVSVSLANSGVAGSLVSVSLTGTNGDLLRQFRLSSPTLGLIGTVFDPLALNLTVTASPAVALPAQTSQLFRIEYLLDDDGLGTHTINVSFQPDCGASAVHSITTEL